MRAVVTRVRSATVEVEGEPIAKIGRGLLILLGVADGDDDDQVEWLARKAAELRIFADEVRAMNRSVIDVGGEVLVVSQFTLLADVARGRRPSFVAAARPEIAEPLCEAVIASLAARGLRVQSGRFGAVMQVASINDGPVTIVLDAPSG
ncbi:MAG: D-aminoacyl-tRNA deacylase [Actinomycetota bacterium]